MLALDTGHLVLRVAPCGRHVQHPHVMQQGSSSQRHTVTLAHAIFDAQKKRNQHHLQTVAEKFGALLAHHRQLESHRPRQRQEAQGSQQALWRTQCLHQPQQGQLFTQGSGRVQQRHHVDHIFDRKVLIDRLAQLVLYQPIVQAAVNAGPLLHQLDAIGAVDRILRDHRAALGHVSDRPQVVGVVSGAGTGLKQGVGHGLDDQRMGAYMYTTHCRLTARQRPAVAGLLDAHQCSGVTESAAHLSWTAGIQTSHRAPVPAPSRPGG